MLNPKNIFFFVLIFITGLNILWVSLNTLPPYYDSAGHTNRAFEFADVFTGKKQLESPLAFFGISYYYPPLILALGGVITSILGYDYKLLEYLSVLIFAVTLVSLYLYVDELTKNKSWAFLAASSFAVLPNIWDPSRRFMLDLPLTFFVIISLYLLEKFKNTEKKSYLVFSFLFLAFAQLTKWYALVYLIIPLSFVFLGYLKVRGLKKTLSLFFLPSILSAVLVLPWYILNFENLLFWTNFFSQPHFGNPQSPFTLKSFLFYPTMLLNYQIVSFQFILFIASCIYFFKNKPKVWLLITLEILLVYSVFTLLGNKNVRFTMPLLPFLSIILGYFLFKIFHSKLGKAVTFGFFLLSFSLFLINSFGFPLSSNFRLSIDFQKKLDNLYFLDLTSQDIPYLFAKTSWSGKKIVGDIHKAANDKGKTKILVVSNNPYVSVAGLEVFNRDKERFLFVEVPLDRLQVVAGSDLDKLINLYDFLLVPDQTVAPPGQQNYFNLDEIRKYILAGKTRDFALVKTYKLPNNDLLYLLRKDKTYNTIKIQLQDRLTVTRPQAVANIYLQFMDPSFKWSQEVIKPAQTEFDKDLDGIVRFRVDYPTQLIKIENITGWNYDGDKQFDRE